jgi:broad specificity phosphatase PhoE
MHLRCIRHGQSASNIGLPSEDHMAIPLTDLGWRQAEEIAASVAEAPDLIVVSPMLRTQQTAKATLKKFPDVPVRVLDIGEFTCLSPVLCRGSTRDQRRKWDAEYWSAADSELVHGEGAESFAAFWQRVRVARTALENLAAEGFRSVLLFSHEQALQALRRQMLSSVAASPDVIRQFHDLNNGSPISNGRGFAAAFENGWRITVGASE